MRKQRKELMVTTASGINVDLLYLNVDDIRLSDIAHSLSNQCRYNGNTPKFYSVAEHSVRLCSYVMNRYADIKLARAILLHDATEAYMGDMIAPLKKLIPEFARIEDMVAGVIEQKFKIDLSPQRMALLHQLDQRICFDEMYLFFDGQVLPENTVPLGLSQLRVGVEEHEEWGWSPQVAKELFLRQAALLGIH